MSEYFKKYHGARSAEAVDQAYHAESRRHEAGLVRYVLKRFGLTKQASVLARRNAECTGVETLTFSAFCAEYPSFPFMLGCDLLAGVKLHREVKATVPNMFKAFHEVPFTAPFLQFAAQAEDTRCGRSVGLIVPRRGFQWGLVVHDSANGSGWAGGLCFVYKGRDKKKAYTLYVRPFSALIEELFAQGRGWRPDAET